MYYTGGAGYGGWVWVPWVAECTNTAGQESLKDFVLWITFVEIESFYCHQQINEAPPSDEVLFIFAFTQTVISGDGFILLSCAKSRLSYYHYL